MKKFVSILLALALILSLSVTAFATTVTVSDATRTYDGYKLLNLTISLKCTHEEGAEHADDCYNYAYTVNEMYEDILQDLAGEGKDIVEYLNEQTGDSDAGYGSLRGVADSIYRAILADTNITADASGLTTTHEIGQGYWLFADVTNLNGEADESGNIEKPYAANSLVFVDTKGQNNLTITPKTDLPTIEKKVQDINDSEDNDINDNDWQDSADHDIGTDPVPFKLTATLPSNLAYYKTYTLVFHDTLSAGLTLDVSSIQVFADGVEVTGCFDCPEEAASTFEISCDNIFALTDEDDEEVPVSADTVFVVTYNATLNDNAVIGAAGNPNTAYLEFSNNPYTDSTGTTTEDEVIVYTYQLSINKTDAQGKPLAGAGFTLYKWYETAPVEDDPTTPDKDESEAPTGKYVAIGSAKTGTGESGNVFEWKGLDDGQYMLEETTVPAGYNKMKDRVFTITADHVSDSKTLDSGDFGAGVFNTGIILEDIENNAGVELPETGAKGTFMLITISTMIVMAAVVFMVTRKKMSIYED